MSTNLHEKLQQFSEKFDRAQTRLTKLKDTLKQNIQLVENLEAKDSLYNSLTEIARHAEKVNEFSGNSILWGENCKAEEAKEHRRRITSNVQQYNAQLTLAHQQTKKLQHDIAELEPVIYALSVQKLNLQDELSEQLDEYIIERKTSLRTTSYDTLPWSEQHNDVVRIALVMLATLLPALLLGYLIPQWELPETDKIEFIKIPERVARLIMKKEPPPAKPVVKQKPKEKIKDPEVAKDKDDTKKEKRKTARKAAEKTGLLAFKTDFAEIMAVSSDIKLGSQASIVTKSTGKYTNKPRGKSGRSLLTSQLQFSPGSGGSGKSNVSVQRSEISEDNKLNKVSFSHIEKLAHNEEEADSAVNDKAQTEKTGPVRSDEEIQVVFDRYKDALYRIYNRELRKTPLLKGKLILRLTIEASGLVSKCTVDSSDLGAPELEKKIIARVLRFNFGEKPGVSTLTILYPIDFLPAL